MYKPNKTLLLLSTLTVAASLATAAQTFTVHGTPDAKVGYNCAISAGSRTLTCQDLKFASSDKGQTVVVYGAIENVNTTSTTSIGPGVVTVIPESMANITAGMGLWVQNANGSDAEQLQVSSVTPSSFTAYFTQPKSGTWSIVSNYLSLYTTVSSVTNSSTVTLAAAATKGVSSAMVQVIGRTDNRVAIQNTFNSACAAATESNPATVTFPPGIYGFFSSLYIPNSCSYVTITGNGKATLFAEPIASLDPTSVHFGQGGGVIGFGVGATAPGRATANLSDNTTIQAGDNVLSCGGCNFRSSDVGKDLWLAYAGGSGEPLVTTITGMSGSPNGNGIYPAVTLANDAAFSLPLVARGEGGPLVVIGYQWMYNLNFGDISLMNVGFWFHPKYTLPGIPLINLGEAGTNPKKNLTFHDTTITSATNGCMANNGPLTYFTIENITCRGGTDGAMFFAGDSNNGTITNISVNNLGYPTITPLSNGILADNLNHSTISNATVHCNCFFTAMEVGDYANFNLIVENSTFDGNNITPVGFGSNISGALTVENSTIENVPFAFRLVNLEAQSLNGITLTGNTIQNAGSAFWSIDGTGTGYGPANVTFKNNTAQVSGNAITALHMGGTNTFSGNTLTHTGSKGAWAWDILGGSPTGMNSVDSNSHSGFNAANSCEPKTRCN